jgi:predicted transcriptional regulator
MADVLEICSSANKKTHIMIKANLNYEQITSYLNLLISKGLIEKENDKMVVFYLITKKGREFLECYYNLMCFI